MTQFDDRERAFEAKFARDEEMQFRIMARRNRLLGEWAARLMGLSEVETEGYAKDVVRADFEEAGDEDVIRRSWAISPRPESILMKAGSATHSATRRSRRGGN
jgi:hypothetical protein